MLFVTIIYPNFVNKLISDNTLLIKKLKLKEIDELFMNTTQLFGFKVIKT